MGWGWWWHAGDILAIIDMYAVRYHPSVSGKEGGKEATLLSFLQRMYNESLDFHVYTIEYPSRVTVK